MVTNIRMCGLGARWASLSISETDEQLENSQSQEHQQACMPNDKIGR